MAVVVAGVALAALGGLAACGGGGGGGDGGGAGPATAQAWMARYGSTVRAVDTALDRVQGATKDGEPVGIRTNCEGLRDTAGEATDTPAVPDQAADEALRAALKGITTGAADCLRSISQGDARLLERSITELREARLQLDTAKAKLAV